MKFGAVYCIYDDHEYLDISIESFKNMNKVLFLINNRPWKDKSSDNSKTVEDVKNLCKKYSNFELIQRNWIDEAEQRNYGLTNFFKEDIDYCFIVDVDEVYHNHHVEAIKKYVLNNFKYSAFHIKWNTYWTKKYYVINPREDYTPVICVKVSEYQFTKNRLGTTAIKRADIAIFNTNDSVYNGILIPPEIAFCFHLSYAKTDKDILRKTETFSGIVDGWYENVWKKWDPSKINLHPINPKQYKQAVKENFIVFPDQLKLFIKKERMKNIRPYQCSIIVLNWNSCDLLKRCLKLIEKNTYSILYQVIIVDNGSTKDNSVNYLKSLTDKSFIFPFKIICNEKNLGFSGGVNIGIKASLLNSDICLLNVDAEVQPGWLEEMYNTMNRFPDCGLVGPLGNEYYQVENLIKKDTLVPNLHFFCVLIFSEIIDKIGLFDTLYGIGGYDDNDYGTRARLAGYIHYISAKSLVKHKAHQVFMINGLDYAKYEKENYHKFINKFFGILLTYSRVFNLYSTPELAESARLIIR